MCDVVSSRISLRVASVVSVATAAVVLILACGGSDDTGTTSSSSSSGSVGDGGLRGIDPAGQTCSQPSQCYGGVDGGAIVGTVTCITKVTNGYCTHTCTKDEECCAAPGECLSGVKEVCSPFENQGAQYCFLSCEDADIAKAIVANADAGYDAGPDGGTADLYCQTFAGASTSCRSSGGGSKNRKVCIPKE